MADPVRLRIVDELSGGDPAPGELQGLPGVASNLLAHHPVSPMPPTTS